MRDMDYLDLHISRKYTADLDTAIEHTDGIESLKGKTLLITGTTGTIGSFVTDVLLRYDQITQGGIRVVAAGRNVQKLEQIYGRYASLQTVRYDLSRDISFDFDIDYIIHTAGNAHPAAFNGNPVGTIVDSVNSIYRLLEYGRKHRAKRLLYVSSGEVYGQGDSMPDELDESYSGYLDTLSPRSCYPMAKRAAENLCASYTKQYGLETVIIRPCHTYGPCITSSDNRAHAQFIRNVLDDGDIVLKSTGTQMRSYNYVADCVSALLTVMVKGNSGEVYNTANPDARCTIAQLAGIIAEKAGKKVVFAEPSPEDLDDRTPVAKQVLSSRKIEALGWKSAFSLEQGLEHTLEILKGCRILCRRGIVQDGKDSLS